MDEQYLTLGDQEISLKEFLNNSSNNLQSYISSKPWTKRKADSFYTAYQTIMNSGVTGASNENGVWSLSLKDDIDTSTLSKKDKDALNEAASYILQQMQKTSPRIKQPEIQKPKYQGTEAHLNDFIGRSVFGGRDWSMSEFDDKDERDSTTGKRGVTNRIQNLQNILSQYLSTTDNYDYSGSAFKDQKDLQDKLNNAIQSLSGKTQVDWDIIDSLNAIGIDYRKWFNDGLNDAVSVTDPNGNTINTTWEEYIKQSNTQKVSNQVETPRQQANITKYISRGNPNLLGRSARELKEKYGNAQSLVAALNDYSIRGWKALTPDEQSEIQGAYKYLGNQAIDDHTFNLLKQTSFYKNATKNRFRSIAGVEGFVWDTLGNQIIQIQDSNDNYQSDLFQNIQTKEEKKSIKAQKADQRVLSEGFRPEDYLRMGSMAQDIGAAISTWAPVYGTATSGVLGIGSLVTDLAADIKDPSVSKGQVALNAGMNLGLGALGIVPGLGLAGHTGKWLARLAKWAPRIIAMSATGDLVLSDDVHKSLEKVLNKDEKLTNHDWKNIAYALKAVSGLSRGAAAVKNYRKFKPTVSQNTTTSHYITTKSGKRIKATKEQVAELNSKKTTEEANKYLREVLKAGENEEIPVNFDKTRFRVRKPKVAIQSTKTSVPQSHDQELYSRALRLKNYRDTHKSNGEKIFISKYLPTDYEIFQSAANLQTPNTNIVEKVKNVWNPVKPRQQKESRSVKFQEPRHPQGIQGNDVQYLERQFRNRTGDNPRYTNKTSKHFIDYGQDKSAVLKGLGEDINISVNKNGTVTVSGLGQSFKSKIKPDNFSHDLKVEIGKSIKKIRESSNKKLTPEFIKNIRELSKQGFFFKRGGTINKSANQIITEFLNNQK